MKRDEQRGTKETRKRSEVMEREKGGKEKRGSKRGLGGEKETNVEDHTSRLITSCAVNTHWGHHITIKTNALL